MICQNGIDFSLTMCYNICRVKMSGIFSHDITLYQRIIQTGETAMKEIELGNALYKLYHTVIRLEAAEIKDNKNCSDLTVNELNLLECIRSLTKGNDGPTISSIAAALDITRPSTTVAVNKLCAKKMTDKTDCTSDGRSVRVKLTAKGEKAYSVHHSFQTALVKSAKQEMSEQGWSVLTESIQKLTEFLDTKSEQ